MPVQKASVTAGPATHGRLKGFWQQFPGLAVPITQPPVAVAVEVDADSPPRSASGTYRAHPRCSGSALVGKSTSRARGIPGDGDVVYV
jgi:hypothetical protein